MPSQIGELLIKENFITGEQLENALKRQREQGGRLGSILIRMGYVDDDAITSVLSRQYGVPSINLAYFEIHPAVIKLIPLETAQKYLVIPLSRVGSVLTIATADPTNVFAMDVIKLAGRTRNAFAGATASRPRTPTWWRSWWSTT